MNEKISLKIPVSKIKANPKNPRRQFIGIEELALSINEVGLINPIVLRRIEDEYEIVSGNRRFLALRDVMKLKELEEGKHFVIKDLSDEEAIKMMVDENIIRHSYTPYELAQALALRRKVSSSREIADKLGISDSRIREVTSIFNRLNPELWEKVVWSAKGRLRSPDLDVGYPTWKERREGINLDQAREIARLEKDEQPRLYKAVVEERIPSRKLRKVVDALIKGKEECGRYKITKEELQRIRDETDQTGIFVPYKEIIQAWIEDTDNESESLRRMQIDVPLSRVEDAIYIASDKHDQRVREYLAKIIYKALVKDGLGDFDKEIED